MPTGHTSGQSLTILNQQIALGSTGLWQNNKWAAASPFECTQLSLCLLCFFTCLFGFRNVCLIAAVPEDPTMDQVLSVVFSSPL